MEKELTGKQQLETEIRTVDTLLDRGIRIQLPASTPVALAGKAHDWIHCETAQ